MTVETAEDIRPIREEITNDLEAEPLEQPKRRRGRPPLSEEEKARRAAERGKTYIPRRQSLASLENRIGAMIVAINIPLRFLLPQDALDPIEIKALAKSIDEECKNNTTFRKYVETALKVQGSTSLVAVIGIIAGRRVVRHSEQLNIEIPSALGGKDGADAMLGAALEMITSGQPLMQTVSTG